ncbi:MAG: hypothetical protein OEQ39_24770 [Gammaproteobacteria bacterium]|nr:hypothetical protein [Gammaproteobacteria bacterium]MDH3380148.1 hypothetical protein [Gammaproteobacteria bacterium]
MGVRGGRTTNWIYVSENGSIEFRNNPLDPELEQYRIVHNYTRFRVVDEPQTRAFFFGEGNSPPTKKPDEIKSYISGTTEIQPALTNPIGGGELTTHICIGDSLELLEPGSGKLKETQVWQARSPWVNLAKA